MPRKCGELHFALYVQDRKCQGFADKITLKVCNEICEECTEHFVLLNIKALLRFWAMNGYYELGVPKFKL